MISLQEVRQTVVQQFQTAHSVSYSATLVNYPNHVVVDLERQVDPFVSVEISLVDTSQAALGEREILSSGTLRAYFYFRDGTGTAAAYAYADELNNQLGMKLEGSVYYQAVDTLMVTSFPGWQGLMCSFHFDVVQGIDC